MKILLDKRVVEALRFDQRPVVKDGKIIGSAPNKPARHFTVLDAHPSSPTGFGIRVLKSVKTYVLQVRHGHAVRTVTVGRHPDLLIGKDVPPDRNARLIAAELSSRLRRGEDINATRRLERISSQRREQTLRDLFASFLKNYQEDAKRPARANTVKAIEGAMRRLGDELLNKPASQVSWTDIRDFFQNKAIRSKHITAAEQTVRWVSAVFNTENDRRTLEALAAGVEPVVLRNPAGLFAKTGALRANSELQRDYDKKRVRKPISASANDFTKWLDFVLAARGRQSSRTGADYLLLTLITGCRRNETSGLLWHDKLQGSELSEVNFVDMDAEVLVLNNTKNRHVHKLPLPPFAVQLLKERRQIVGASKYVFPATSTSPLRQSGHYTDPRAFMKSVKEATKVDFAMHDLRRTFANIVTNMAIPTTLTQQLLNHKASSVTAAYTAQSLEQLKVFMTQIEQKIFSFASTPPAQHQQDQS